MDRSRKSTSFPIEPPLEPMLAKLSERLPEGDFLYEPKWDGFRAIVFRSASDIFTTAQSTRSRYRAPMPDRLASVSMAREISGTQISPAGSECCPRQISAPAVWMRGD